MTKHCPACNEEKDASAFYRNDNHGDGLSTRCKTCHGAQVLSRRKNNIEKERAADRDYYAATREQRCEYQRAYRAAHPEKYRASQRKTRYGVTVEWYERMASNGCNLCGAKPADGEVLYVDHCHGSGRPRGVLCPNCNTGLGKLGDTVESIERVLAYLKRDPIPVT